jgi:hypothetical protein
VQPVRTLHFSHFLEEQKSWSHHVLGMDIPQIFASAGSFLPYFVARFESKIVERKIYYLLRNLPFCFEWLLKNPMITSALFAQSHSRETSVFAIISTRTAVSNHSRAHFAAKDSPETTTVGFTSRSNTQARNDILASTNSLMEKSGAATASFQGRRPFNDI